MGSWGYVGNGSEWLSANTAADGYREQVISIGQAVNDASGVTASNREAASNAADQRDWETYMDNTKYQRAVKDMVAAGLNPATLSGLSTGSVGSAPSGAAASTHASGGNIIGSLLSIMALMVMKNYGAAAAKGVSALAKAGDYSRYVNHIKGHLTWSDY